MSKMNIIFFVMLAVGMLVVSLLIFNYKESDREERPMPEEVLVVPDETEGKPELPTHVQEKLNLIRVASPKLGEKISSPITVSGTARGYWFFEGSFPITVVNWDGLIIGEGYAIADGEWMTEDFVPFTGTVEYDLPADSPYTRGAVILRKDNPSGLPENDDAVEIPVELSN